MSLADVVLPRMREENEKLRADIERLQAESNISDGLLADAKAEIEQLTEANRRMAKGCEKMGDEIGRLKAVLKDVIDDIHEYERVNNLAPNPPRIECWDSVARARRALEEGK